MIVCPKIITSIGRTDQISNEPSPSGARPDRFTGHLAKSIDPGVRSAENSQWKAFDIAKTGYALDSGRPYR